MKRIVYHDSDYDGFTSAAVLKKKFPDIETVALDHESRAEPEAVEGYDEVYMCDFSFSQEFMDKLKNNNKQFYWIDHHETPYEKLPRYDGLQRFDCAAVMLTWEFCFPNEPAPLSVQHVSDQDIWAFKHPKTRTFMTYYAAIFDNTVDTLLHFLDESDNEYEQYYEQGKLIEKGINVELAYLTAQGFETIWQGKKARIYFYGGMHRSLLAQKVLDDFPEIELFVGITLIQKENKSVYKYSLRSRKGEAKVLAEQLGGGGHPNSAGIVRDDLLLE